MRCSSPLHLVALATGFSALVAGQFGLGDLLPTLQLPTLGLPTLSILNPFANTEATTAAVPPPTGVPAVTSVQNTNTLTSKLPAATRTTLATSIQTTNAPGRTTATLPAAVPTTQPSTLLTSPVPLLPSAPAITNPDPNSNPNAAAIPEPATKPKSKLSTAAIAGISIGAFFLILLIIASLIPTIRRWRSRPERTHQSLNDDPFGIRSAPLQSSFNTAPRVTEIRRKEIPSANAPPQTMTAIAVTADDQSGRKHGRIRSNVLASIPEGGSPLAQQQRMYRPEVFELDAAANPMQSRQRAELAAAAGFIPQPAGSRAQYSNLPEVAPYNGSYRRQ